MLSDLERRVKIFQCLSTSLTKIHSARATGSGGHVSLKWHVYDDVIGDKIEQSRTLCSSYFVDTFLIKTRRFVRPIRMPRGPVVTTGGRSSLVPSARALTKSYG